MYLCTCKNKYVFDSMVKFSDPRIRLYCIVYRVNWKKMFVLISHKMDMIRENVLPFQYHHKHKTDALRSIYDVSHSSMSYILIEDVNAIFDRASLHPTE